MPNSDAIAQISKNWPGIPIISFNSAKPEISHIGPSSADTVDSIADDLGSTRLSSSESCKFHRCGKAATLVCGGCKDLPAGRGNEKIKIRYCSSECQKEDWKTHKASCKMAKSRQLLYRSASVIKALFYVFQEITFIWGYFQKIERYGRYCVVFLDEEKNEARKTMLVPFSTVVNATSDSQEQEALLTHLSCNEAVANFGPYLLEMLKANLLSIEEITVVAKNLKIEILKSQDQSNNQNQLNVQKEGWHHTILRVTLRHGEKYAIDLTGAQYGHYQECVPWKDYLTTRIEKIVRTSAFGAAKQLLAEDADRRGYPRDMVQSLTLSFAKELGLCIKYWKDHGGETFNTLLASTEIQYQQKTKTLLELVKKLMEMAREDSIQKGSWSLE